MMNSSSFESPKPYLFGYYLKYSITTLLRYVILAPRNPIYVGIYALACDFNPTPLYFYLSNF